MDRRTFIEAISASLTAVPLASVAERKVIARRIGVLSTDPPPTQAELTEEGAPLRALGWVEGENLVVERRYTSGRSDPLRAFAQEFVRLGVEIICTQSTPATLAAKNATSTIPIVIWSAGDPVSTGLVASLSRPGGNITGLSLFGPEMDAKRLTLVRELLPALLRLGVLENAGNPYFRSARSHFGQTCRSLGIEPIFVEVTAKREMESVVTEMAHRGAQALLVPSGDLFYAGHVPLLTAATTYKLPSMVADRRMLAEGAMAYYGYSEAEQDRRFASFVDRILRGAKPSELPMEQPTRFELGVNLKTAKALGLTVPNSILLRAEAVIE